MDRESKSNVGRLSPTWAVRVDDGRDLGVRVDSNKIWSELVTPHNIDRVCVVLETHFLQSNTHLKQPPTVVNKPVPTTWGYHLD